MPQGAEVGKYDPKMPLISDLRPCMVKMEEPGDAPKKMEPAAIYAAEARCADLVPNP